MLKKNGLGIVIAIILSSIAISCGSKKNVTMESNENYKISSFKEAKEFYLQNMSDKQKLKYKLAETVLSNPKEQSDLFALFILNSNEPFYFMGGATYSDIGRFVEPELFKKVCFHLLDNLEQSEDLWFDIQQIGRWVDQDFVPRNSNMNLEEKIEKMTNKLMDYYEEKYQIEIEDKRR